MSRNAAGPRADGPRAEVVPQGASVGRLPAEELALEGGRRQ